jgi:hypothetical protein
MDIADVGGEATGALERLGAELGARGYQAHLITAHTGAAPWLAVCNPQASMLSEKVMAQAGWFLWPWADRIAPTAEVDQAADRVAWVLRANGQA